MMNSIYSRQTIAAILVGFLLSACGQQSSENSGRLEADAYLGVAEIYRDQGQYRASLIEAQNALQAAPDYDKTRRFISRVYLDLGNALPAEEILASHIQQVPNDIEAILLLAEAKINTGAQGEALDLLENLQTSAPSDIETINWLRGNAYAQGNNSTAAQESFLAALEADPSSIRSLISLSIVEYQSGNEFGAQQYLDRAIETNPIDLDLWIWRGQFAALNEDYPTAEEAYFEALQIMGNYDTMTAKRFSVLNSILLPLQMQQKNDEALRYSQLIADTPQGQMQNSFDTALTLFQDGNFEEVEQSLGSILSSAPDHAGSNILLGMTRYAQGDFSAAMESLEGLVSVESSSPEVIKTLAATHIRLNQPESAISVLEEAIEAYPNDASLLALIAVSHQVAGDYTRSIDLFEEAIALEADSADIRFALARSYYFFGDGDSTIENLNAVLSIDPNYVAAKSALLDMYLTNGETTEALRIATEWSSNNPTSANDLNLLGRVVFSQGELSTARSHFLSSLELDSSNIEALLYLARINTVEQSYDAAVENFKAINNLQPSNLDSLSGLLAIGDLSNTAPQRIADVLEIIDDNPNEFSPPLVLSQYYLSKNELNEALPLAESAYRLNVNTYTSNTVLEILFRQIEAQRVEGDFDASRDIAEYALQIDPDNMQALILAANIESQSGSYNAASAYIDRIRELQPEGSSLSTEVEGDLYFQRGEIESALESYQVAWASSAASSAAIKLHRSLNALDRSGEATLFLDDWIATLPNDPAVNLIIGLNAQQANDTEEAVSRYEVTLEQQPNNIVALNNLAWLYQDEEPARSLELARRASDLAPENPDVLDTFGWILLNQNNKEQAVSVLERAAQLAPESSEIREHLETARNL